MQNNIKRIESIDDIKDEETYLPTESPYSYLDYELVINLSKMILNKFPNSSDIIKCIIEIEKIHAKFVCEYLDSDNEIELIDKIQNDYRNNNKKWLQHEIAYREFYTLLNGEDVF